MGAAGSVGEIAATGPGPFPGQAGPPLGPRGIGRHRRRRATRGGAPKAGEEWPIRGRGARVGGGGEMGDEEGRGVCAEVLLGHPGFGCINQPNRRFACSKAGKILL